ncbi:MAG: DUF5119 domain-containing protein [Prevotellaceae bacterium]|jgi:hypothetical protein|nr:DUF5119 domain-containing protein [Prevotellaceae bacterium]
MKNKQEILIQAESSNILQFLSSALYMSLCVLFMACTMRTLSEDDGCRIPRLKVVIYWEENTVRKLPSDGMRVQFFPFDGGDSRLADVGARGGDVSQGLLNPGDYTALCYDYFGNDLIQFRGDSYETMEAFCTKTSTQKLGCEPSVWEPYPYDLYVTEYIGKDSRENSAEGSEKCEMLTLPATIGSRKAPAIEIPFYPRNVLREFTFLIYGVTGAAYIGRSEGEISGMATGCMLASGKPTSEPSTLKFGREKGCSGQPRIQAFENPQYIEWSKYMLTDILDLEAPDPKLLTNSADYWDGDWIIGSFCTFGAVDTVCNMLTLEVYNMQGELFCARWGGGIQEEVRSQIQSAMGRTGSRDEQLEWRRKNGGFDIVLPGYDLEIKPSTGGSVFEVDVDSWEDGGSIDINPFLSPTI